MTSKWAELIIMKPRGDMGHYATLWDHGRRVKPCIENGPGSVFCRQDADVWSVPTRVQHPVIRIGIRDGDNLVPVVQGAYP